jgi:hypothetical protein
MKTSKQRLTGAIIGIIAIIVIVALFFATFWNDYGEIPVTEEEWVNVINLKGVENLNHRFEFGEKGLITDGGKIKRLAEYENQVLVRYITPNYTAAYNEIPEGTIFFISKEKFIKMSKAKPKDDFRGHR